MKINWSYLFKLWFSTLLVAPILSDIIIYYYTNTQTIFNLTSVYPIAFIFGFIFSLPTYIVFVIMYYYLAKKEVKLEYSKFILISLSIIGIVVSFYLIFNNREPNISLGYSLTSIFFGIIYKLNFKYSTN